MVKIIGFIFVFYCLVSSVQAQGINWFGGSVDKAIEQASSENKSVFVYCGTEW